MGPLSGVKVIDLTSMVSGPMGAMMLADQGAEVIKVEPIAGEQLRHMAAPYNGVNPAFFSCNRGKKSLAIDLKSSEGKAILLELTKQSDVFMQNFRPGTTDRMGFGYDFGLADILLVTCLDWAVAYDFELPENISNYHKKIKLRDGYKKAVKINYGL